MLQIWSDEGITEKMTDNIVHCVTKTRIHGAICCQVIKRRERGEREKRI